MNYWLQVVHFYFLSDDPDSDVDNEVLLLTTDEDKVERFLRALDADRLGASEVSVNAIDPRDGIAWAQYDGEPEISRMGAEDWLERRAARSSRAALSHSAR